MKFLIDSKRLTCTIIVALLFSVASTAQVAINTDGSVPDNSAMLDVKSTSQGVVIPRMTYEERNSIPNPTNGLMVYCTNCNPDGTGALSMYQAAMYQGGQWKIIYMYCPLPASPAAGIHIPTATSIIWNWSPVPIAQGYKWNTVDDPYSAIYLGTATTYTETGLTCSTTYNRYIWAYNECGETAASLSQETSSLPISAPVEGTHIPTLTTIKWNWSTVSSASGYKFNTTNDFATATDMGTSTTYTQTGQGCGNALTSYVWAYNSCGVSVPVTLNQSTLSCSSCGSSFAIFHSAGAVAPVSKIVTYGTVINVPGEPYKCWLTSNLGSDHQATSVDDATEASAGWYWQFNRKQGYIHNGATRTPNTPWVSVYSESSDWLAANDPCTLELGGGWRIPTSTEWVNVDGYWSNWNHAWNSLLKLHAAGYLYYGDLTGRGGFGNYWSSRQYDLNTVNAYELTFYSSVSGMDMAFKHYGFPLRCIKD